MLEIEYRISCIAVGIVLRRSVDEGSAEYSGAWRIEENLGHLAVRHILYSVEICIVGWNLDSALPTGRAVIVISSRIIEDSTVNSKMIVVETLVHRTCSSSGPYSVFAFDEIGTSTLAAESEADIDSLCIRCDDAETCIALGVDHRILLSRLIEL